MNIRPFEIALIGFFVIAAIAGVVFMSMYKSKSSAEDFQFGQSVEVWGVLDAAVMQGFLEKQSLEHKSLSAVSYKKIDIENFEEVFVDAVAEGRSPDLLLIPHTLLVTLRTKLTPISPQTIPSRTFKDTYIDGADIFMRQDGVYGIPLAADPLVMYWNRDIFSSAGLAQAPKTWESLMSQTIPAITQKTVGGQITRSAIAFGGYSNVQNAKAILSMLLLQTGNTIVEDRGEDYAVTLGNKSSAGLSSGEASLGFYTQFASPSKEVYSWNQSRNLDRNEFIGGTLGMYFGLGSEWQDIEAQNPNLSYDVTRVPQGSAATISRTYADFYAFAIPRASQNAQGAFALSMFLGSSEFAQSIAQAYNLTPVHRVLYAGETNSPFTQVLHESALIARGWLDPDAQGSDDVFRTMINEVLSGNIRYQNVVLDAVTGLENLF